MVGLLWCLIRLVVCRVDLVCCLDCLVGFGFSFAFALVAWFVVALLRACWLLLCV